MLGDVLEVLFYNVLGHLSIVDYRVGLEVQFEAAHVEVGAAHAGHHVIDHAYLGIYEASFEFVDMQANLSHDRLTKYLALLEGSVCSN